MKKNAHPNRLKWILTLLLFSMMTTAQAAPGDLDTTFGSQGKLRIGIGGANDSARAIVRQTDGKLLVVGSGQEPGILTSAYNFSLARYNANGSLDTSFGTGGKVITSIGTNSQGHALALLSDGKILAAGYTDDANGRAIAVVKYNSNGSLDTSFGGGDGIVTTSMREANAIAVQPDGKIVVAGRKDSTACGLARYNPNGSLDTSFGFGGPFGVGGIVSTTIGTYRECHVKALKLQGSKIVAVGYAVKASSSDADPVLLRYQANGSLDTSFGVNGRVINDDPYQSYIYSLDFEITVAGEEKIIVAGSVTGDGTGDTLMALWRYDQANGALDTSFGSGGRVTASFAGGSVGKQVKVQTAFGSASKIVVAGTHYEYGTGDIFVARYLLSGAPDASFSGDGVAYADVGPQSEDAGHAMLIQSADNKIVVAGASLPDPNASSDYDFALVRFNSNGSLDTTFDADGVRTDDVDNGLASARAVAIQADGKILAAGRASIARFNTNGTLDTSFDFDGRVKAVISQINAIAVQADGKIVVAGRNAYLFSAARYNTNGSLDTSFSGDGKVSWGGNGSAKSIAIQADGKIVIAGQNLNDVFVVRCNANGSPDALFGSNGEVLTPIGVDSEDIGNSVLVRPDGKIVVAGQSLTGADNYDFAVVRYNANGSLDASFNDDGIVITSITSGNDVGLAVTIQPNNRILVAGTSAAANSLALVRYNNNGLRDLTFDGDGILTTNSVAGVTAFNAIAFQTNGKILAAGYSIIGFNNYDFAVVRYNANGSLDTTYSGDGKVAVDFNGAGGKDIVNALALDSSGRAVVAGEAGGLFGIARLQGDSSARSALSDFDGDAISGTGILQPNDAEQSLTQNPKGQVFAAPFGSSTDKPTPADFTGDGRADIAFWRPSTGEWFVLRSEDGSSYSFPFGSSGDVPAPADFDGDGRADAAVFRPSNLTWYISKSSGGMLVKQFGSSGDVSVPADFDGDGQADLAVFRPSNGTWYLLGSSLGFTAITFGQPGDRPVPVDYDGDGKADLAVYRAGTWYLQRSLLGLMSVSFGAATDVPAPADYDGDGRADVAVFKQSNGNWHLNCLTGGFAGVPVDAASDLAVPAASVP